MASRPFCLPLRKTKSTLKMVAEQGQGPEAVWCATRWRGVCYFRALKWRPQSWFLDLFLASKSSFSFSLSICPSTIYLLESVFHHQCSQYPDLFPFFVCLFVYILKPELEKWKCVVLWWCVVCSPGTPGLKPVESLRWFWSRKWAEPIHMTVANMLLEKCSRSPSTNSASPSSTLTMATILLPPFLVRGRGPDLSIRPAC